MNDEVQTFSSLRVVFSKDKYWSYFENKGWMLLDIAIAASFDKETQEIADSLFWRNLSTKVFQIDNMKYDGIASIQFEKSINKFKINFNPRQFYEFIIYSAALHERVKLKNIQEVPFCDQIPQIIKWDETLKPYGWNLDFYNLLCKDGWNDIYCWKLWTNMLQHNNYVFKSLICIFVHEMMHLIWDHVSRMIKSEDHYNWNVAADFAINQNLPFPHPLKAQLISTSNKDFWPKAEFSFLKYLYRNDEIILSKKIKNDLYNYEIYLKNRELNKIRDILQFNYTDEIKNKNADFYYDVFKENMPKQDSNKSAAPSFGFEHFFTDEPFGIPLEGLDGIGDGKEKEKGKNGNNCRTGGFDAFEQQMQQIEIDKIFKESYENSEEMKISEKGDDQKSEIPCSIPLREKMDKLKKKIINNQWKKEFKRFILRYMNEKEKDITMTRSSRKRPGIFPGMKREIGLDVIFIIDTSGSIGREDYNLFINEIININKICDLEKCRIIQCHTAVSDDARKFSLKKINSIEFKETGGTRMRSALDVLLNEKNKKPVVIFTDGFIDWFAQEEFPFKILLFLTCKKNAYDIRNRGFQVICPKE